jgi:LysM repeat protein
MRKIVIALAGVFVFAVSGLHAQSSLKGSRTAMRKQNSVAQKQDYTFLRTSSDVSRFVSSGYLVPVKGTSALKLADVSFPYARPAVKTFAERLAQQYRDACGNKLVVTSLTRPLSRQPWNASDLSVHPAGMALDIRVSDSRACRKWLESTLVSLEKKGVLEATRERRPAHYHVAVFPSAYFSYLNKAAPAEPKIAKAAQPKYASVVPMPSGAKKAATHKVRSGESLWSIARKYGVTLTALKEANALSGNQIKAGQVLAIPRERGSQAD